MFPGIHIQDLASHRRGLLEEEHRGAEVLEPGGRRHYQAGREGVDTDVRAHLAAAKVHVSNSGVFGELIAGSEAIEQGQTSIEDVDDMATSVGQGLVQECGRNQVHGRPSQVFEVVWFREG